MPLICWVQKERRVTRVKLDRRVHVGHLVRREVSVETESQEIGVIRAPWVPWDHQVIEAREVNKVLLVPQGKKENAVKNLKVQWEILVKLVLKAPRVRLVNGVTLDPAAVQERRESPDHQVTLVQMEQQVNRV